MAQANLPHPRWLGDKLTLARSYELVEPLYLWSEDGAQVPCTTSTWFRDRSGHRAWPDAIIDHDHLLCSINLRRGEQSIAVLGISDGT